jgi:hypothetical protein
LQENFRPKVLMNLDAKSFSKIPVNQT